MFLVKFFFHILESLTLDLIPSYFRRYLLLNSDNSGVFNDSRKMLSKTQEMVFYPKDNSVNVEEWKEEVNSENYHRNLSSSVFAHILTILILMLFSPLLVFAIVLYPFIAVFIKFLASIAQAMYALVVKKYESSEDKLTLAVEAGLGRYSSALDRKNAISFSDSLKGVDNLDQSRRKQRNSDFIKERTAQRRTDMNDS